jgi:hypothetical protein
MSIGHARISRREFYRAGGLAHLYQFRKGTASGWSYWRTVS